MILKLHHPLLDVVRPIYCPTMQQLQIGLACQFAGHERHDGLLPIKPIDEYFCADDFAGIICALPDASNRVQTMTRGTMTAYCVYGSPHRGDAVYVRILPTGNRTIIGSLDALPDISNGFIPVVANVHIPTAQWASGADKNGIAEIQLGLDT